MNLLKTVTVRLIAEAYADKNIDTYASIPQEVIPIG